MNDDGPENRYAMWQAGEQFNRSAWTETFCCLWRPGGGQTIGLSDEELVRYRADPDAFAADYFGLTKEQYREWVGLDGAAWCGGTTSAGKLCRNFVMRTDPSPAGRCTQLDPHEWLARHRKEFCTCHGGGTT